MGGMGLAIYEDGVRDGIKQGEKQGEVRGSFETLVACVQRGMGAFGASPETLLAAFGVPREEWPAVIARLDLPAR